MYIYNKYIIKSLIPVLLLFTLVVTSMVWIMQTINLSKLIDKGIVIPETITVSTAVRPTFENLSKTAPQKPEIEPRPVGVQGDFNSFFSESGLNASQWDFRYSKTHNSDGTRKETVSV